VSAYQRPGTAPTAIAAALRRRILSGDLAPGTALRQEALADDFGVSRVPVREALRTLESEGHIAYATHRGYRVAQLHLADLEELYHLRGLLEDDLVRRNLPTVPPRADNTRVWAYEELSFLEVRPDPDPLQLARANRKFHWALLKPGPRADRILTGLWDASEPYRARWFASPEHVAQGARDHAEINRAARAGDTERVVALLAAHRAAGLEALRRQLAP
jgi:DNA-binding GntR family transcriptional regulator